MSFGSLTIQRPGQPAATVELAKPQVTLGRDPSADVRLDDGLVSRFHAVLRCGPDGVRLTDNGSTNGTFVNGVRVPPRVPVLVPPGADIGIGQFRLAVHGIAPLPAQPPAQAAQAARSAGLGLSRGGLAVIVLGLGALSLLALLGIGAGFFWPRLFGGRPLPTAAGPVRSGVSLCAEPLMPVVAVRAAPTSVVAVPPEPSATGAPTHAAPTPTSTALAAAVPAFVSLGFLELPFPYDGGNERFGGTDEQFRRASQRSANGGRLNSFFDHLYPLYPAPNGREPSAPPAGERVLLFDGVLSANDYYSGHPGYDFSVFVRRQPTTPVFAAADGVVVDVGVHPASGALFVKLRHHLEGVGDFLTIYWHLHPDEFFEAMRGRVGQPIAAGTRIGTMGSTGWSTGHHLHFEVRFDSNQDGQFMGDEVVDPFGFIPTEKYPADPWGEDASFADARGVAYHHAGIAGAYLWIHPLGSVAQVPATGSGQVQLPGDGAGGEVEATTLCAPPGALPAGGTVLWTAAPDPPPTDELAGVGHGCALAAFDGQGVPVARLGAPVVIELPYSAGDLHDVLSDTLQIYWLEPGSERWLPLPTWLDQARQLAGAETDRPGRCALLGRPARDLVRPRTKIEAAGPAAPDGTWYGPVTVSLSSEDASGIRQIEYSLDGGTTWLTYAAPFTIQPGAVPAPPPAEPDEGAVSGGPGWFLVLAAATDGAGNVEDPPAFRRFAIDPSKAPTGTPTPTYTPSRTATPTPTATSTRRPPTPLPVCTPPPCPPEGWYVCPAGACANQCGVVCITPTPVATPVIRSVTRSTDVVHDPEYSSPYCEPTAVSFEADVYDAAGLTEVALYYQVVLPGGSSPDWLSKPMALSGAAYTATLTTHVELPHVTTAHDIRYFVKAFNAAGGRAKTEVATLAYEYCYSAAGACPATAGPLSPGVSHDRSRFAWRPGRAGVARCAQCAILWGHNLPGNRQAQRSLP